MRLSVQVLGVLTGLSLFAAACAPTRNPTQATGAVSGKLSVYSALNESTNNAINTPTFGRISTQAGFMRIWQLSFRYRF